MKHFVVIYSVDNADARKGTLVTAESAEEASKAVSATLTFPYNLVYCVAEFEPYCLAEFEPWSAK